MKKLVAIAELITTTVIQKTNPSGVKAEATGSSLLRLRLEIVYPRGVNINTTIATEKKKKEKNTSNWPSQSSPAVAEHYW